MFDLWFQRDSLSGWGQHGTGDRAGSWQIILSSIHRKQICVCVRGLGERLPSQTSSYKPLPPKTSITPTECQQLETKFSSTQSIGHTAHSSTPKCSLSDNSMATLAFLSFVCLSINVFCLLFVHSFILFFLRITYLL